MMKTTHFGKITEFLLNYLFFAGTLFEIKFPRMDQYEEKYVTNQTYHSRYDSFTSACTIEIFDKPWFSKL